MRQALVSLDGVVDAQVSYDDKRADVRYQPDLVAPDAMVTAVADAGFDASLIERERAGS